MKRLSQMIWTGLTITSLMLIGCSVYPGDAGGPVHHRPLRPEHGARGGESGGGGAQGFHERLPRRGLRHSRVQHRRSVPMEVRCLGGRSCKARRIHCQQRTDPGSGQGHLHQELHAVPRHDGKATDRRPPRSIQTA